MQTNIKAIIIFYPFKLVSDKIKYNFFFIIINIIKIAIYLISKPAVATLINLLVVSVQAVQYSEGSVEK